MGQLFCFTTVGQSEVALLETCGRFVRTAGPGCHCILPWTYKAGALSLRLNEHQFVVRSKTKDNVFVNVRLAVQVQVMPEKVDAAFYSVEDPRIIIQSYVSNSVETKIPFYNLDALFIERGSISQQLKNEIGTIIENYGWDIVSVLITEIDPGDAITDAINSIQKYQRLRVAAIDEAETKKMLRVRAAEADCEARRLAGKGLAEQRKAIVAGLRKSVELMRGDVPGLNHREVMNLLTLNQYYDTIKAVADGSTNNLLFVEGARGVGTLLKELKTTPHTAMK